MFKLCFNTNGLRNLSLAEALAVIRRAGYEAVEISLHDAHLNPLRSSKAQVAAVRRCLNDEGLEAACVATGANNLLSDVEFEPSLICSDPAGRRRRIDLMLASVEVAHEFAAPVVNFASGFLREGVDREQARQWLAEGVFRILERARPLALAIEPEPNMFIGTTTEAAGIIALVARPNFRMNPDIGHINVVEDDFLGAVERSVPLASHMHVEDIRGRVHYHLIPGEGDIDFAAVFGVLAKAGYQGAVSVELYTQTDRWQQSLERSMTVLGAARAAAFAAGAATA